MERVSFTQMKDGTAEEYRFLGQLEEEFCERTADRLLAELRRQQEETLEEKLEPLKHCMTPFDMKMAHNRCVVNQSPPWNRNNDKGAEDCQVLQGAQRSLDRVLLKKGDAPYGELAMNAPSPVRSPGVAPSLMTA